MTQSPPIVRTPDQQHMLFLFVPLKAGTLKRALHAAQHLAGIPGKSPGTDTRTATGVHFAMFYGLEAGTTPPGMPVPTFATAEGKDLLVALAIYDADFGPYISAFTNQTEIAEGLNGLLHAIDETGIVPDSDPTSAAAILAAGGVQNATDSFYCLLMRYNFGDPTIPGASVTTQLSRYLFVSTFPGLTVGKVLQNYPGAQTTWPWPPQPMNFQPSIPPTCPP
jgi:hypothetical protein